MAPVPDTVLISAERGWGIEGLLEKIDEVLNAQSPEIEVRIPYDQSKLVDLFRRRGAVDAEEHTAEGTVLRGKIPRRYLWRFAAYVD